MKQWLSDLNEGDEFWWQSSSTGVCRCRHCGDAHNLEFRTQRIKIKIIESPQACALTDLDTFEIWSAGYVYDNKEEATEELKKSLERQIDSLTKECTTLLQRRLNLRNLLKRL